MAEIGLLDDDDDSRAPKVTVSPIMSAPRPEVGAKMRVRKGNAATREGVVVVSGRAVNTVPNGTFKKDMNFDDVSRDCVTVVDMSTAGEAPEFLCVLLQDGPDATQSAMNEGVLKKIIKSNKTPIEFTYKGETHTIGLSKAKEPAAAPRKGGVTKKPATGGKSKLEEKVKLLVEIAKEIAESVKGLSNDDTEYMDAEKALLAANEIFKKPLRQSTDHT